MFKKSELKDKAARVEEARSRGPKFTSQKRKEGDERNAAWAKLSRKDKLAHLDKCGLTATKQRAKLEECSK